jgi:hypothetical protein
MVIQNACPRFSRSTLFLSAITLLACLPSDILKQWGLPRNVPLPADISGRMSADCKDDLS